MSKPSVRAVEILTEQWKECDLSESQIETLLQNSINLFSEVDIVILKVLDEMFDLRQEVATVLNDPRYKDSGKVKLIAKLLAVNAGGSAVSIKNYKEKMQDVTE